MFVALAKSAGFPWNSEFVMLAGSKRKHHVQPRSVTSALDVRYLSSPASIVMVPYRHQGNMVICQCHRTPKAANLNVSRDYCPMLGCICDDGDGLNFVQFIWWRRAVNRHIPAGVRSQGAAGSLSHYQVSANAIVTALLI